MSEARTHFDVFDLPRRHALDVSELERRYRAGTVGTREFAGFYASTLAGRAPAEWEAERRMFLEQEIAPRLLGSP